MNRWILLLTLAALAGCHPIKRGARSCPALCSCSPSGSEVECSRSSLTSFPSDGLSSDTTRLSIQSTGLRRITAGHLSLVPHLNDLQLYHNNLSSLPLDLLRDVPRLTTLDLTGNQLVRLPPNIFNHSFLLTLILKNNRLERADAEWFPDNSNLTRLDLSGNRLAEVPTALLLKLSNMEDLDLSNNHLQDLQPDALKNLQNLKSLNLAGNKLRSLNPSTFIHNSELTHLFLQENQLQQVPATLLRGLKQLELLMLNENQLRYLPTGLLDHTPSSFNMVLAENPWVCDEKMVYLWRWITANSDNVFFLEDVKCAGPEDVRQRQVISLTDGNLLPHNNPSAGG